MTQARFAPFSVSTSNPRQLSIFRQARRHWPVGWIGGIALGIILGGGVAHAASADADAQQLAQEAILGDYLRLDFKKAARKLRRALGLCKKAGCSPTIEAHVLRDLAVVYVTGQNRKTKGRELLVEALTLDPRITLDSDFTTPELVTTFKLAQRDIQGRSAKHLPPGDDSPIGSLEGAANANLSAASGSVDCPPDFPGCESLEQPQDDTEDVVLEQEQPTVRHWLTVSIQQDVLVFSDESGVCLSSGPDELSCYRANDEYRQPPSLDGLEEVDSATLLGGEVEGGLQVATTRVLLGYQRQMFLPQLRVGAVLGYAFSGGPSEPGGASFLPYHVELNGRYTFGSGALPIIPFVSLAAGVAQVDASVITEVVDRNENPNPNTALSERSRVTVWKKAGTTFGSIGGGLRYPLGASGAITALGQLMYLFPSSGTGLAFQLGYAYEL